MNIVNTKTLTRIIFIFVLLLSYLFPLLSTALFAFIISQIYSKIFDRLNVILCIFFAILSVISYVSILSFTLDYFLPNAATFWVIHASMAITSSIYMLYVRFKLTTYSTNNFKRTVVSLIVTGIAFGFMLIPGLHHTEPNKMVYFLSSGEDNASHFAMFHYNWTHKSAPYFNTDTTGIIGSLKIYPQGIHTTTAYGLWSIFGDEKTISIANLLKSYYIVMAFTAASLLFICSELIGKLIANSRFRYLGMTIGAVTIFTGAILYLVGWGFLTQILAITYILSIVFLSLYRYSLKNKNLSLHARSVEICLYGLMVIGVVFSWYLLLFVAFILLIQRLILLLKKDWQTYILSASITIVTILPILVNYFMGKGSGAINEPGGVYIYGPLAGLFLLASAGLISLLYLTRQLKRLQIPSHLYLLFISSYAMFVLIGAYQLLTTGTVLYYFHKSLYLAFISAVILVIVLTITSWGDIKQKSQVISIHIACIALFGTGYAFLNPTYPIVFLNNWFNHIITPQDISPAIALKDSQSRARDVIYQNTCNYTNEYILNRWTGALFLSENSERSTSIREAIRNQKSVTVSEDYLKKHPDTIVVNQPCG